MAYTIRRVDVSGFLGYRGRVSLSLGRGIYALVGENGAGKSSLVDAIRAALTLPRGLNVRGSEPVNNLSKKASIRVELADGDGSTLVVEVEKQRGGPVIAAATLRGPRGIIRARSVREAQRLVADALGLPGGRTGILEYTSLIRQGGLDEVIEKLTGSPSERRRFIEEILGIRDYARAKEALTGLEVEAGSGIVIGKTTPNRLRETIQKRRKELEELASGIVALRRRLAEAEERIAHLRSELRELSELEEEYRRVKARLDMLSERERELERLIREYRSQEGELSGRASRLGELEREASRLEGLAGLSRELERLRRLKVESRRLEEKLESLLREKTALGRLRELQDSVRRYEELRGRRRSLVEKRLNLQQELSRLQALLEEQRRILRGVDEEAKRLAALLSREGVEPPSDPRLLAGEAEKLRGSLEERAERLESDAKHLEAEAISLEERARELRERAERLRGARGGRCPLCGAPLSPDRAEALATSYEEEASRLAGEARSAKLEAERKRGEAGRLSALAREVGLRARLLARLLAGAPSQDEIGRLEIRARELEAELAEVESDLKEVESRLESLEEARREYDRLRGIVSSVDPSSPAAAGILEELIAKTRRALESLREEAERLEKEILEATGARDSSEAERLISEAARLLPGVKAELEAAREAAYRLEVIRDSIRKAEAQLEDLRREAGGLQGILPKLEVAARRSEEVRGELERLSEEAARLRGELEARRGELEGLKGELGELERLYWKALKARRLLEILEEAPPLVLRTQLSLLSRYMSEALSGFGLDVVSASFRADKDGLGLVLTRSDGSPAEVGELSGGERVALALSFVVALSRLHAIRAGFLVLDEPTAHLDPERRRVLVGILRRVAGDGGIPQLLVVTHDEDVAEAADVVCRVERTGGSSRILCGGGGP